MTSRNLPHLFLVKTGEKEPYTARGGGSRDDPPERDRAAHGARISSELSTAVEAGRAALSERGVFAGAQPEVLPGPPGLYIEFAVETGPRTEDALKSLEARDRGIELVAVRTPPPNSGGDTIATVFVPEDKVSHFERRLEEYRTKETSRGRPRHEPLVASINSVRVATPRSVFMGSDDQFPADESASTWWELWIRTGYGAQVAAAATHAEIDLKPHIVRFVERDVQIARASVLQLRRLMAATDGVAELRIARDTPAFFMRESNIDQAAWTNDLLTRVASRNAGSGTELAVCILDGGIARAHPLLAPHIASCDVMSVNLDWGGAEDTAASHAGHGTGMAGLTLYGDLTEALAGSSPLDVPFVIESVKILPPMGNNEPELYGQITLEAIGRAEVQTPDRQRIICSAVTAEDSGQGGRPSAWSAAIDRAAFDAFGSPRLVVISAGNIRDRGVTWVGDYLERNDTHEVESPAQAWNALTIGAYTEKVVVTDTGASAWQALAPAGDLCPSSRTGLLFSAQWPVKPDVVLEGGNYAHDGGQWIDALDDLQLLTTHHRIAERMLTTFGDTSAATALGARLAARVAASRPSMWPETVRALVVHSADWTPAMLARTSTAPVGSRKRTRLRRYGYGVPDLTRAVSSATNDLTLVVEDELRPFKLVGSDVKTREMAIHRLPWPAEVLASLNEVEVELRVTLSYFVEPNPGERGWTRRYRYASHGLRFDVKRQFESDQAFRNRLNAAVEAPDGAITVEASGSEGWSLGPNARNAGSIHSDVWKGTAADLASRAAIGVYPIGGWWRELKRHERYGRSARYALVASIRVPGQDVDIYTPVRVAVELMTKTDISVQL